MQKKTTRAAARKPIKQGHVHARTKYLACGAKIQIKARIENKQIYNRGEQTLKKPPTKH